MGALAILTADALQRVYTVRTPLFTSDANAQTFRDGSINLRGTLCATESGKHIGHFKRRFITTRDGAWHAMHEEFFVNEDAYKRNGIARLMFGRAVRHYATHGVAKISLDAVRDGRYVWLAYGFKPEPAGLPIMHETMKRVYKKASGKDMLPGTRLPKRGHRILDFKYRGVPVGRIAVGQTPSMILTLDLRDPGVRWYLVARLWLPPWRLMG